MEGEGRRRAAFGGTSSSPSSGYQFYSRPTGYQPRSSTIPSNASQPPVSNEFPVIPPRRNSDSHIDDIDDTNITIPITQNVLSALLSAGTALTPPLTFTPLTTNRLATLSQVATLMNLMNPINSTNPLIEFSLNTRNFMEPVQVRPTSAQIAAATRIAPLPLETETCTICQDSITPNQSARQILHCEHWFHRDCIDPWFQQNVRCPVCRFDIRDHTHSSIPRRSRTSSVEEQPPSREN